MKQTNMIIIATIVVVGTIIFALKPSLLKAILGVRGPEQGQAQEQAYKIHDDATFEAGTKPYSMMPLNDMDLAFSIRVPTDWEADTSTDTISQELDQKILHNIARFKSPMIGIVRATLTIQALKLEHEISADNWLRNFIITNGYAPQGEINKEKDNIASAAFVWTSDETASAAYMRVIINGGKILVVRFDVPVFLQEFIGYLQKKSVESFQVAYEKNAPVETQKAFTLVDSVKFFYPISWSVTGSDFKDMNRLNVQLQNTDSFGKIQGFVNFVAVRRTRSASLNSETANIRHYINESFGLDVVSMKSSDKSDAYERFIFNRYEVYEVLSKDKRKRPQELHLVTLGDKEWYIFVFMITPMERDGLYTWARNLQTFKMMIRSIK
jgi:hypothetical protein